MEDQEQPTTERWAVCIDEDSYAGELQIRKMYEVLPDADAEAHEQLRVVDESGEDYLYPKRIFLVIEIPAVEAEVIRRAC